MKTSNNAKSPKEYNATLLKFEEDSQALSSCHAHSVLVCRVCKQSAEYWILEDIVTFSIRYVHCCRQVLWQRRQKSHWNMTEVSHQEEEILHERLDTIVGVKIASITSTICLKSILLALFIIFQFFIIIIILKRGIQLTLGNIQLGLG